MERDHRSFDEFDEFDEHDDGFPEFAHGQFTFEGEIERFGAFARGAARVRGWRRAVAILLTLAIALPVVLAVMSTALLLAGRHGDPEPSPATSPPPTAVGAN